MPRLMTAVALVGALILTAHAADGPTPARYAAGSAPLLPVNAIGGGEVLLQVAVDPTGRVETVKPLRTTPPFTEPLIDAVRTWRFFPATDDKAALTPSTVLVAELMRAPTFLVPTFGELPRDVLAPRADVAFPTATMTPAFPPTAHASGVVIVEARIDRDGPPADVSVVRSAPPFDEAARSAAAQWRFRAARGVELPAATYAYIVFGFPMPITGEPPTAPPSLPPTTPGRQGP
jgi:TonB family protein